MKVEVTKSGESLVFLAIFYVIIIIFLLLQNTGKKNKTTNSSINYLHYNKLHRSGAPTGAEGARGRSSIPIENGKSIKPRKFGGRPRPYVRTSVRTYVRTD